MLIIFIVVVSHFFLFSELASQHLVHPRESLQLFLRVSPAPTAQVSAVPGATIHLFKTTVHLVGVYYYLFLLIPCLQKKFQ